MKLTERDEQIIETMIDQLGRGFCVMTGAKPKYKQKTEEGVQLVYSLKRNDSGANYFYFLYREALDCYAFKFEYFKLNMKTGEVTRKTKQEFREIYCDQLREIFYEVTGLYTTLR